jgi:hypothetical protein
MMTEHPARIHLLPAKASPVVCIIRRKPSKCFHIIKWNTSNDEFEHGSWFHGKLYPMRCDVSFDGQWMVYLAMGANGETWNGICNPPWLKTIWDAPNMGTWGGGGYWESEDKLLLTSWEPETVPPALPFQIAQNRSRYGGDPGVLFPRMERDGWRRVGPSVDLGWIWRPTSAHPTLRARYRGYPHEFEFGLDEHPGLLDPAVEWATWDSLGQLVVTRAGRILKYGLQALEDGRPSFERDFETLSPPRPQEA